MNKRVWGAGIVLTAMASTAWAQPQSRSVEQMTTMADLIAVGTVSKIDVRENPQNRMIYTFYTLELGEVWKGTPVLPAEIMQAGGTLNGITAKIAEYDYKLRLGQTMVLFALRSPENAYIVIGLREGLYTVGAGPEYRLQRLTEFRPRPGSDKTLAGLKREVCTILGRPYEPPSLRAAPPPKESERKDAPPSEAPKDPELPPGAPPPPEPAPEGRPWGLAVGGVLVVAATLLLIFSKKNRSGLMN
ncbi:MAG: hypothetical protein JO332_10585 [Planctomycetaceae bacterium]|nr:hypothetical protein [Planctomycetaceae bacterium]